MRKGLFVDVPQRRQPLTTVALCEACKLYRGCVSPFMPVWGKGSNKVLICGEAPGELEDAQGIPFVGKSGLRLRRTLDVIGVDLEDCWVTNACICHPPNNKLPEKSIEFCRPYVIKAIRDLNPEVIVLLGGVPVKSVLGWLWKEDPKGISRWAGCSIPCQSLNTWICATWHPAYLEREEHPVLDLQFEEHLSEAFSKRGRPWKTVPHWEEEVIVEVDDEKAAGVIEEFILNGAPIAWDIECDSLKPDADFREIYSCSVSDGYTTISFPWQGAAAETMKELLRLPIPKIGWNIKYETRWCLKKLGFAPNNWCWDGMLASHAIDSRKDVKSLKYQAFTTLGMSDYSSYTKPFLEGDRSQGANTKNRIHEADLTKILRYGGTDALLTYKIAQKQMKTLGVKL